MTCHTQFLQFAAITTKLLSNFQRQHFFHRLTSQDVARTQTDIACEPTNSLSRNLLYNYLKLTINKSGRQIVRSTLLA